MIIALLFAAALTVLIVLVMRRMSRLYVVASHTIDASLEAVWQAVSDLRNWQHWNPWIIHEPNAQVIYADDAVDQIGSWYSWNGKHIGSGMLTHTAIVSEQRVDCMLRCVAVVKLTARITFLFEQTADGVAVTWRMSGGLPFFLFMIANMVTESLQRDYQLGLLRLDQHLNPNAQMCAMAFDGVVALAALAVVSNRFTRKFAQLAIHMQHAWIPLLDAQAVGEFAAEGLLMSAYMNTSRRKQAVDAFVAVAVSGEPVVELPLEVARLDGGKFFKITYNGDYTFMTMVWNSAMNHLQMYAYSIDTKRHTREVYLVGPNDESDPNKWVTQLYIPIK